MKILNLARNKRFYLYAFGLLISGAVLTVSSIDSPPASAQAANSVYLAGDNGSYPVGTTFTIAIRENSGSAVNAAQADLAYSNTALEFVSIDSSGSAFGIDASSTGGNGSVSIARGTTNPVTGDQLVAKVTFKALAVTTATVQMQSSSVVLSSSTNANIVNARSGGTYTLTTPSGTAVPAPKPGTVTIPTPVPTPPASTTTSAAASSRSLTNSSVTIASQGSSQTAALPGDSVVELSTPATVEATPASTKAVTKVEYLVDKKLVATIVKPPYSYSVDTAKYRNGAHTLTTKTYYKDGVVDSSNASLVVKNPFGPSQLLLQIRHYAWVLIVVVLAVIGALWFKSHRGKQTPKFDAYGNETLPDYGPTNPTPAPPQTTAFIAPAPTDPTVTVEPTVAPRPLPQPQTPSPIQRSTF